MKRYFYDCEFIEDGHTIELVSIGIAADDGRTYYAVNRNVHWERLGNPKFAWIRQNVWPHLPLNEPHGLSLKVWHADVKDRVTIAREVRDFLLYGMTEEGSLPEIELWGDYPAYDHVVLCQLWGRMVDLPPGIPMRTNCLVQYAESMGINEKRLPEQDPATKHHALHDAKHNLKVFSIIHPEPFREPSALSRPAKPKTIISQMTTGKTYNGRAVTDQPL